MIRLRAPSDNPGRLLRNIETVPDTDKWTPGCCRRRPVPHGEPRRRAEAPVPEEARKPRAWMRRGGREKGRRSRQSTEAEHEEKRRT